MRKRAFEARGKGTTGGAGLELEGAGEPNKKEKVEEGKRAGGDVSGTGAGDDEKGRWRRRDWAFLATLLTKLNNS